MIGDVKQFDSNKAMFFKVTDNKLPKSYFKIWCNLTLSSYQFNKHKI